MPSPKNSCGSNKEEKLVCIKPYSLELFLTRKSLTRKQNLFDITFFSALRKFPASKFCTASSRQKIYWDETFAQLIRSKNVRFLVGTCQSKSLHLKFRLSIFSFLCVLLTNSMSETLTFLAYLIIISMRCIQEFF